MVLAGEQGGATAVFNSLPWERREVVTLLGSTEFGMGLRLVDIRILKVSQGFVLSSLVRTAIFKMHAHSKYCQFTATNVCVEPEVGAISKSGST